MLLALRGERGKGDEFAQSHRDDQIKNGIIYIYRYGYDPLLLLALAPPK